MNPYPPVSPGYPAAPNPAAPQAPAPIAEEQVLFEGHPALIPSLSVVLICVLTLFLALIYFAIVRAGTHYRITNQRIVIDRGIFSKKMDQLDLYRINDFQVDRPFGQRIMGTGNLKLTTFDKSTPSIELSALPVDVVALYEAMRKAVEASKHSRGVRMVDYEGP